MRVVGIQTPAFTALRYGRHSSLKNMSKEERESLPTIREELKNTQLADLVIAGKNAIPVVKTPYGAYSTYFIPINQDESLYLNYLKVRTLWAGPNMNEMLVPNKSYIISIPMEHDEIVKNSKLMNKSKNEYERGAILTKILDKYFIEYEARKEQERLEKLPKNSKALKKDF